MRERSYPTSGRTTVWLRARAGTAQDMGGLSAPLLVGVLASASALSGCGSNTTDGVANVAEEFYGALADRDGAAACALLAPATRSEVQQAAGKPCPQAVVEERLPSPGGAEAVHVFNTASSVEYRGETTFLALFDDGWKVTAAGCTARPPHPYDCTISGG